jgi:hypothetical protein
MPSGPRPSNLAVEERLLKYLALAEAARVDSSLIANHVECGVVNWLEWHLLEIRELLDLAGAHPEGFDEEFLERLRKQERAVSFALWAYGVSGD